MPRKPPDGGLLSSERFVSCCDFAGRRPRLDSTDIAAHLRTLSFDSIVFPLSRSGTRPAPILPMEAVWYLKLTGSCSCPCDVRLLGHFLLSSDTQQCPSTIHSPQEQEHRTVVLHTYCVQNADVQCACASPLYLLATVRYYCTANTGYCCELTPY